MLSIRQKAENYAISFFLSEWPEELAFDDLLEKLDKQAKYDYSSPIVIWEPFEDEEPSWIADQINIMAYQLTELFSENIK